MDLMACSAIGRAAIHGRGPGSFDDGFEIVM